MEKTDYKDSKESLGKQAMFSLLMKPPAEGMGPIQKMGNLNDEETEEIVEDIKERMEAIHPEMEHPNSPFLRAAIDLSNEFVQIEYIYPMLSLSNTYNRVYFHSFFSSVANGLNRQGLDICCALKFDGLSISITY